LFASLAFGQVEANSELHLLLAQKDSLVINAALTPGNTNVLEEIYRRLEFYHIKVVLKKVEMFLN
jgi:hypothetical protein